MNSASLRSWYVKFPAPRAKSRWFLESRRGTAAGMCAGATHEALFSLKIRPSSFVVPIWHCSNSLPSRIPSISTAVPPDSKAILVATEKAAGE